MKVLFLCSSLEPGRDGVGDYTRRLAGQLLIQGYQTGIVALHDRHLKSSEIAGSQFDGQQEIHVFRLSSELAWEDRILKAQYYVKDFDPDFISLQYVSYGFQDKGLPFRLSGKLKKVVGNIRLHIMFHELWLGIRTNSSIKHKIYGYFQTRIAKNIIDDLAPCSISTSNKLYQLAMERKKIISNILPLFSNIPILEMDKDFVNSVFNLIKINDRNDFTLIGIFGTLYPHISVEQVIHQQYSKYLKENKKLVIIFFGRIGYFTEYERLKKIFSNQVDFVYLGELSEREVSSMLQILDKVISCTPFEYLGKSGVYAAFKLHNLEVISVPANDIPEYALEINSHNCYLENRNPNNWSAEFIARKFINLLYTHRLSYIFGII